MRGSDSSAAVHGPAPANHSAGDRFPPVDEDVG